MAEPLVRATGVRRRYAAILALVGVTLDVGAETSRRTRAGARHVWQEGPRMLATLDLPADERAMVDSCLREADFLTHELTRVDREIARYAVASAEIRRLMTIPGVDVTTAATWMATIGRIDRFPSPRHLVGYLGLDPRSRHLRRLSDLRGPHLKAGLSLGTPWPRADVPQAAHPRDRRRRPQALKPGGRNGPGTVDTQPSAEPNATRQSASKSTTAPGSLTGSPKDPHPPLDFIRRALSAAALRRSQRDGTVRY
jgi:hypothetical protein